MNKVRIEKADDTLKLRFFGHITRRVVFVKNILLGSVDDNGVMDNQPLFGLITDVNWNDGD